MTDPIRIAAAPTVNDDVLKGYQVGQQWIHTGTNTAYECVSASAGAAIWRESQPVNANLTALTGLDFTAPSNGKVIGVVGGVLAMVAAGGATMAVSLDPNNVIDWLQLLERAT